MLTITFEAFKQQALADGADEVLARSWDANTELKTHTHPFDAKAVVAEGEMWLTCAGQTQHLTPGSTFELASGTPHAERYGPKGATYWVARTQR
jgi:mannose-6-phosphate isomerase-like protein (cupin superfamily)